MLLLFLLKRLKTIINSVSAKISIKSSNWPMKSILFSIIFLSFSVIAQPVIELRTPPKVKHGQYIEELLAQAYADIGYEINHVFVPGVREIPMAVKSEIGGVLARDEIIELSNSELVKVAVPLFSYDLLLLANTKLCGECKENYLASIAYPRGGKIYEHYVKGLPQKVQRVGISGIQSLLQMLQKGRVDAVILADVSIPNKQVLGANIKITNIETRYDYHYLAPTNEHLKAPLEQALKNMIKTGKLAQLKAKYGIN